MIGKRMRFGLCTTSPSLIDQVKRITARKNIDLEIAFSSLDNAIPEARRLAADGVDVILAGATTSIFLMENISVPVVVFGIDSRDVITCFARAVSTSHKMLLPMLRRQKSSDEWIGKMLGVEIHKAVYHDTKSARKILDKALEEGYDMAFGGGYITDYAKEIGLPTIEFARPDYKVEETIESAINIVRSKREDREKFQRYRLILDTATDGVVAVDERGVITAINKTACELLKTNESEATGTAIDKVVPKTRIKEAISNNRAIKDSIEKVKNRTFVWNHQPFVVTDDVAGCVSTFNQAASVMRAENKIRRTLSKGHVARYVIEDLLHQSDAMKKTVRDAVQYAKTGSNLLISGETGTGKEVLVQSIHNLSNRRKMPFVSINCAALPDQLLESELFGYEEGAFTGSKKGGKAGLFELAHNGTIFLDEIGETSEHVQIRLLRVLQEREIMRLGDDRLISVDVRVIAASNRDLAQEVQKGNFRSDLFFRLNVLSIHIPPLRSRPEDIPILVEEFIRFYSNKKGLNHFQIPDHYMGRLQEYPWPGNVRQLQNFAERLVLLLESGFNPEVFDTVYGELVDYRLAFGPPAENLQKEAPPPQPVRSSSDDELNEIDGIWKRPQLAPNDEREVLKKALEKARYSKSKTAEALGISRSTLWKKLKRFGLG